MVRFLTAFLLLLAPVLADEKAPDRTAYRVLGHDRGKIAILDAKGKVEWELSSK